MPMGFQTACRRAADGQAEGEAQRGILQVPGRGSEAVAGRAGGQGSQQDPLGRRQEAAAGLMRPSSRAAAKGLRVQSGSAGGHGSLGQRRRSRDIFSWDGRRLSVWGRVPSVCPEPSPRCCFLAWPVAGIHSSSPPEQRPIMYILQRQLGFSARSSTAAVAAVAGRDTVVVVGPQTIHRRGDAPVAVGAHLLRLQRGCFPPDCVCGSTPPPHVQARRPMEMQLEDEMMHDSRS